MNRREEGWALQQVQLDGRAITRPPPELVARFEADLRAGPDDRLGLAVSGGGDSLALLLLAHAARPGRVSAATIDHGIRPESAAEATMVGEICRALGVRHARLKPAHPPQGQAAARELRYGMLHDWAAMSGQSVLVTAHHLDDQAETLMMRLNRGSGVAGLAGVRAERPFGRHDARVRLLRPLLGWRRAELADLVANAGLEAVQDPSNADPRYDRSRMRSALAEAGWIDPVALARSAAALAEAEEGLAWATDVAGRTRLVRGEAETRLDPDGLPPELLRRLVLRALWFAGGSSRPPRGDALERLVAKLRAGEQAMLCDILVRPGQIWRFAPAPPRRSG